MRFDLNQRGVDAVLRSHGVTGLLTTAGEVVKREVESQAERFAHTHHFARSIETTPPDVTPTGVKVTVFSTDNTAHIIEMGSKNNPAYAPFRKAASSLGLPLRGGGTRP